MKTSATKMVMELKGELKLITSIDATWNLWYHVFVNHNNDDIVNPQTTYKNDPKMKVPPIFYEFLGPYKGCTMQHNTFCWKCQGGHSFIQKSDMDDRERVLYFHFLERKKN